VIEWHAPQLMALVICDRDRFLEIETMRVAEAIELDEKTTAELLTLSKGRRVEARVQQRAIVILLAAQGWQNKDIALEVKLDRRQVALWRRRFIESGLPALMQDASRAGRTPSVTSAVESNILHTTLHKQPPGASQWSTRTLALHLGLSATTIRRVWRRNGIQPHLNSAIKASVDQPLHVDPELVDVVGLYMNPRERVLVFSGIGNSPLQKPNRTSLECVNLSDRDPGGHGMTSLLAALKKLEDAVLSACQDRHHHEEWFRFLRLIDRKTPRHLQLHLVVENHATHKRPKVQAWLAQHPRLVVHSTPPSASWLKSVSCFLQDTIRQSSAHDRFTGAGELQQAIAQYIERRGKDSRPFIWSVSAPDTAQATRAKAALARWSISAEQNGAVQHEADVTTTWA
jgi:transposase